MPVEKPEGFWDDGPNLTRNQDVLFIAIPVSRELLTDAPATPLINEIETIAMYIARAAVKERIRARA